MLPTPTKFTLVTGSSEGRTELTAFDKALLAAGIGNLNLVKVSSILPPGARAVDRLDVPPGSLLPVAYASITSAIPGELIAAAVAVGLSPNNFGVIMEFSGRLSGAEAEARVRAMVEEAFETRRMPLGSIQARSVEHRVSSTGCAFAAVALWY